MIHKKGSTRVPLQNQFSNQKWLIDEEYSLLWTMDDQMPSSIHQPNWDMVASAINCFTGLYRSAPAARIQFETTYNTKEEVTQMAQIKPTKKQTKIMIPQTKDKKNKSRISQMFHQDNNRGKTLRNIHHVKYIT